MVQRIYFLGLFLREASRNEDCNAVPELESHNLYLFFQAVQIKNQTGGWVLRSLDPENRACEKLFFRMVQFGCIWCDFDHAT